MLVAPGIWPELMPGRGSGIVPAKRPAERASKNLPMSRNHLLHLREILHCFLVEGGVKDGWGAMNLSRVHGETGFDPSVESAIEKVDILRSEGPEGPPCSGCGEDAFLLVDDDVMLIADSKSRHVAGKDIGRRQHVGQRIGVVGERFDIKEDCARNVLCDDSAH